MNTLTDRVVAYACLGALAAIPWAYYDRAWFLVIAVLGSLLGAGYAVYRNHRGM